MTDLADPTVPGAFLAPRPFTAKTARAAGIDRNHLHRLVAGGELRAVLYGVYVRSSVPDSIDLRARAAALVLPPHAVVADRCAAWLHDVDILAFAEKDTPPALDAVSVGGKGPSARRGVFGGKRDLSASDIMVLPSGLRVTTPLRTACDVACLLGRHRAIATLDEFRRKHHLSVDDLASMLPRFRGRRGVTQLRELIPLSTDRADSQPESWTRLTIRDAGLPTPEPQVEVLVPGWGHARLENAYRHRRIAVEYDGEEHHSSSEDRERDDVRRGALVDDGWIILVLRKGDFAPGPRAAWLADLSAAIDERTPGQTGKRRYARGTERASYRWRRG
ncbi:type IV toxin-antitoxin system AbiEi family antitoxin domain-containing protein [Nocardioides caeni]|uniref:DUF559 domain-containing protein n=1 Tax=Nocardioides caeni TaxID=574700 RepID=A0A4S8NE55_9ACTN|nr:type IV toxin-antitoxin system AbiEi family antitoxin domain-containing protein [Nocardioides caeni]THV14728.1 hypothetical protein E9934_08735 [Nocardioides caeni]